MENSTTHLQQIRIRIRTIKMMFYESSFTMDDDSYHISVARSVLRETLLYDY